MISGGVNPGRSLGKWMGQRMKEVSGKANLTFSEVGGKEMVGVI